MKDQPSQGHYDLFIKNNNLTDKGCVFVKVFISKAPPFTTFRISILIYHFGHIRIPGAPGS